MAVAAPLFWWGYFLPYDAAYQRSHSGMETEAYFAGMNLLATWGSLAAVSAVILVPLLAVMAVTFYRRQRQAVQYPADHREFLKKYNRPLAGDQRNSAPPPFIK